MANWISPIETSSAKIFENKQLRLLGNQFSVSVGFDAVRLT
jgi:hypothetical protein